MSIIVEELAVVTILYVGGGLGCMLSDFCVAIHHCLTPWAPFIASFLSFLVDFITILGLLLLDLC